MAHFILNASDDRGGFGKRKCDATEAALVGRLDSAGKLWKPDYHSVMLALPHRWRKAFERSGGNFWFDKYCPEKCVPYLSLSDRRGRYLTTIYAFFAE